jgi:hypothetical protein
LAIIFDFLSPTVIRLVPHRSPIAETWLEDPKTRTNIIRKDVRISFIASSHRKNPVLKTADQGQELEIAEFMSSFNLWRP